MRRQRESEKIFQNSSFRKDLKDEFFRKEAEVKWLVLRLSL